MYHEKQIKELCALHTLNNLFQDCKAFTKANLDEICLRLSPGHWINPHKSILGTGNYDINVIMAALTVKDCSIIWFDKRKNPDIIVLDKVVGLILNIPCEYRFGPVHLPVKRKHWVAIRSIKEKFYNLDSKLDGPDLIGEEKDLIKYLQEELKDKNKELFIVVTHDVEKQRSWCVQDPIRSSINLQNPLSLDENGDVATFQTKINKTDTHCRAFDSPGLAYIDQDASSRESSLDAGTGHADVS